MVTALRYLLTSTIVVILAGTAALGEPRIRQEVRPNFGTTDDVYILSVIVEDAPPEAGAPLLKGGADFDITLIGPSHSIQILNGAVHRTDTYDYQLTPKREGILGTPVAELSVDSKKIEAEHTHVTVKGTRETTTPDDAESGSKDFFMLQRLNPPQRAFVGQQITHSLEIFTRTSLMDPQLSNLTFPGFRNEPLGDQENGRRYINGVPFAVSTLRRALFPDTSGKIDISERELKAKVRAPTSARGFDFDFNSTDPFDPNFIDSFFSRGTVKPILLHSNSLKIQIDPLPPLPADLPLLGLDAPPVGQTVLRVNYDNSEIEFGATKTVIVTVSSVGNIQPLKGLGLKSSSSLKIYEESPQTKNAVRGDLLWTTRTIKLSLVPLAGSLVELPAIRLAYFDPATSKFEILTSEPIRFTVKGGLASTPLATMAEKRTAGDAAQSSSGLTDGPGIPPLVALTPRGPQLTYEEPGALELFASRISLPFALLALAAATLLALAVVIGLRLRARGNPHRALQRELSNAQSPDALAAVLRAAICNAHPTLSANFSRDELRKAVSNKHLLYQIESLLDSLDSTLFGGQASSIEEQKAHATDILRAL